MVFAGDLMSANLLKPFAPASLSLNILEQKQCH